MKLKLRKRNTLTFAANNIVDYMCVIQLMSGTSLHNTIKIE